MNLRSKLAVRTAKSISKLIKKMNRGSGATLPGYVAHLIDPKILSTLSSMVKESNIVVMGTNGKTTTNAILFQTLEDAGHQVIINRTGANMLNGIVSAFVLATEKDCTLQADYACIEVDEIASARVLPLLTPDYALLTNISRDQIDRFGEMESIVSKIKSAFDHVPQTTLVINGDDVFSYSLAKACKNPVIIYGINENVFTEDAHEENVYCRSCEQQSVTLQKPPLLEYQFHHYGQLGLYHCPVCGLKRPTPEYSAFHIRRKDGVYSFIIDDLEIHSTASATYNIYNTLAAVAVLRAAKANVPHLKASIEGFDYGNNRESTFVIGDAKIQLHLAKNPIGFQQKMALMIKDENPKDVIFLINDTYQDGEDVSWLWDVDFMPLAQAKIEKLFCGGIRKYDVGLRLKYDEIDMPYDFVQNLEATLKLLMTKGTKNIYLILNYSNLFPTHALLTRLSQGKE